MLTLPVRVFDVCVGTSAEDPERRTLVTCRRDVDAHTLVVQLEHMKARGMLVDGGLQFFHLPADVDIDVDAPDIETAVASGYRVRSVVLSSEDVPKGRVLATIAGDKVSAGDKRPDPAEQVEPAEAR